MKPSLITLAAIMLLPLFSLAQSNYKPGYVVDLKGDTLKGSVNYQEWEKNPASVTFKNAAGLVHTYTPQITRAFGVTGLEYYEKHTVKVSLDPVDIANTGTMLDTSYRVDTVFLKMLTKGRYIALYSFTDPIKSRYYVLPHGDAEPEELVFHAYINANSAMQHVNGYRLQLQSIAQNNNVSDSKLAGLLSQSEYRDRDLLRIAATINGSDPSQLPSHSQVGSRFFAGAGVSYTDMVFTGMIQYGDSYGLFPRVGAGMDFFTNKNVQRLFVRLEISATGDAHTFTDKPGQSQLKMTQYSAAFTPQVYYNFYNSPKLKVFAGGGLSINFATYPTRYYTSFTNGNLLVGTANKFPDYHAVYETFLLKAGITLNNRIEIYAGYVPVNTITNNYTDFAGNVTSYQAGVNFLFGTK